MNEKFKARRILIIGSSGAGKSTISKLLGERLGLDVVYLDRHYYKPGWVPSSQEAWRDLVTQLVAKDEWIMDGDFSDTFDIRFPRAEVLIDLAYSRYRCLFQVFKRLFFAEPVGRVDLPESCQESFDWSLVKWIWNYPSVNRPRIESALSQWGRHLKYVKFTSPRQLERWISEKL